MSKKTVTIPASVGSNALADSFGKINLSNEVKEFLSALGAELNVRYIVGGEKPIIEIVKKNGKLACSLDEFKALSGYRRWVGDFLKELDKESSATEKIKIVSHLLRLYRTAGNATPARILDANYTKFNQIGAALQVIAKHSEIVAGTIDNAWRTYVEQKIALITRFLLSTQYECMGPNRVESDYIDDALFNNGVPRWLYTKLLDKNFTNNLKRDCQTLLFSKGNYLKSIALTTSELADENFIAANQLIVAKSGGIIALSRVDFSQLFPTHSNEMDEDINAYLAKYQWVLTNPFSSEEILEHRLSGKAPPVFRAAQRPQIKQGSKQRPETETQRVCREIGNILGLIQSTWQAILNFVIPVASPKTEFWNLVFPNSVNWQITPTNTIYACIQAEANFVTALNSIRNASNRAILSRIACTISAQLMIPHGSADHTWVENTILPIHNRQDGLVLVPHTGTTADYPIADLTAMETTPLSPANLNAGKEFLGILTLPNKKKKKSGASAVRLHTSVINELNIIKSNEELYEGVKLWLTTTFKTGDRHEVQRIAAERVVGEALKHQEVIFDEDFEEEEILGDVEEYYDSDDE